MGRSPEWFYDHLELLGSPASSDRERALLALAQDCFDWRREYQQEIQEFLKVAPQLSRDAAVRCAYYEVLGYCDLSSAMRDAVLAQPDVPDYVRARLGDEAARARSLAAFTAMAPIQREVTAFRHLFFIGLDDPDVARLMVTMLNSTETYNRDGDRVSLCWSALSAYGRCFETPRFGDGYYFSYQQIEANSEFGSDAVKKHLARLSAYFHERHGWEVHLHPPFFVLLAPQQPGVVIVN